MKVVLAKSAVDFLRRPEICVNTPGASSCDLSTADIAAREAIHFLGKRTHATGGLILLDRHGNPGFAFNTPRMAYCLDRKSTRLNSSHQIISYAVFCLKKKTQRQHHTWN